MGSEDGLARVRHPVLSEMAKQRTPLLRRPVRWSVDPVTESRRLKAHRVAAPLAHWVARGTHQEEGAEREQPAEEVDARDGQLSPQLDRHRGKPFKASP